jgi:hypothetical protein
MTIVEMDRETDEGTEPAFCIGLTLMEEKELADAVMKLLTEPIFRGPDRTFLEEVYWDRRSRFCPPLWAEDLDRTMDVFVTWSKNAKQCGDFECSMPTFLDGNDKILENNAVLVNAGATINVINLILLVWEDAWERYKPALMRISDGFKTFAGSKLIESQNMLSHPKTHLAKAMAIEDRFWIEVERVFDAQKNISGPLKLNWSDSYQYARDYMRRGRDVIPRVLMHHWLEQEALLIQDGGPEMAHPEEEWVQRALEFSVNRIAMTNDDYSNIEKYFLSNPAHKHI